MNIYSIKKKSPIGKATKKPTGGKAGKGSKKKKKGSISFFSKVVFVFNILLVIALLLSYLASFVSPAKIWIIAFFGIAYPFLVLANFIFIIYWIFFKRWFVLISLITILLGWNMINKSIRFGSNNKDVPKGAIKVLSFNVRNFDLYNYKKNWALNFEKRNLIFSYLNKEKPDIICFQEFFHDSKGKFKTVDTLVTFLKATNFHTEYTAISKKINFFGIATFSSFPIIAEGKIPFVSKSGNICIYTDLLIHKDTVRIYNVHFESIRFGKEDYGFAENVVNMSKLDEEENIKDKSQQIISRLKRAFIRRAPQADLVAEHIKKCPYPVILCGDFNDTPTSYAYHQITTNLFDSFEESGSGLGQTYVGAFPSFRIDYILHSKQFKSYNFSIGKEELSDHYPVKCYLKLNKK